MSSLECPHCGLINPGGTDACECGWSFRLQAPARGSFGIGPSASERRERTFQSGYGLLLLVIGLAILVGPHLLGLTLSPSVGISMIVIGAFWSLRGLW